MHVSPSPSMFKYITERYASIHPVKCPLCVCLLSLMVYLLTLWKFVSLCHCIAPPTTHCWSCGASLIPACTFSYVDEFVYVYECVRVCLLTMCSCMFQSWNNIVWCSVAWSLLSWFHETRLICICGECPNLKPVKLCLLKAFWWTWRALLLLLFPLSFSVCTNQHTSLLQILTCTHFSFIYIFSFPNLKLFSLHTSLTCCPLTVFTLPHVTSFFLCLSPFISHSCLPLRSVFS